MSSSPILRKVQSPDSMRLQVLRSSANEVAGRYHWCSRPSSGKKRNPAFTRRLVWLLLKNFIPDPVNYRPISIISAWRVMSPRVVAQIIHRHFGNRLFSGQKFGFRPSRSTDASSPENGKKPSTTVTTSWVPVAE